MLKRILGYKFHIRPLFNLFLKIDMDNLGNYKGVNDLKREVPVIVSLTSYRERFDNLPKTIYSLLNQKMKPDRIILWLDKEYEDLANLPYSITRFIKNGLEIRFVEDIKSYTKAIYAFKEFPESIIITADDDIYYRDEWLERLYLSYITNPKDIHVHRAHRVKIENGEILPYKKWLKHVDEETARYDNFLTGVGGVLYPPKCFSNEVFRSDIFLKCSPNADDIWFWIMALANGRKIRVVKNHYHGLISTSVREQLFGETLYLKNKNGGNDEQFKNLMQFYGQNIKNKLGIK